MHIKTNAPAIALDHGGIIFPANFSRMQHFLPFTKLFLPLVAIFLYSSRQRVNAMTGRVGAPSIPQQAGGPENLRWTAPNTSSSSLERTRPAGGHPARTDKRKYLWAGSLPSQASSDGQPLSGSHFLTTPLTTQRSEKARHERATSKRCHQARIGPSPPPQPP